MKFDFKIGEKVALIGGGCFRNEFFIVKFLGVKDQQEPNKILESFKETKDTPVTQVRLETDGKSLPNPFEPYITPKPEGLPLGGSTWSLAKLHEEVKDLPLGH